MHWLIEECAGEEIHRAYNAALMAGTRDLLDVSARDGELQADAGNRLLTAVDGTAEIRITGVLLPGVSLFSYLYGGGSTRYGDIRDALAKADQDPAVKRIVLNINSPGGAVDGLFETVNAVRAVRKPISVRASAALSAAYALAAATGGPIVAESEASQFGSIGVATPSYYFLQGEEVISITSTEAPKKRPDVRTEEGRAVIREHLDAVHKLFVEAIADGRRTKASDINANYGRGATLLAREAKAAGMIDRIPTKPRRALVAEGDPGIEAAATLEDPEVESTALPVVEPQADAARGDEVQHQQTRAAGTDTRTSPMTEDELKAQHPALYASIFEAGEQAGRTAGITEERNRCEAHLTMGEASGDMQTATEAIKNGEDMTQKLQAKYMAAGMNRAAQTARETETTAAAEVIEGVSSPDGGEAAEGEGEASTGPDLGDQVVAVFESRRSKKAI